MAAAPSASRLLEEPHGVLKKGRAKEEEEEEARDWAELPRDALLAVFHKLDHIDILTGPDMVCSPWRRATMDEPELWRRIDMRFHVAEQYPGVLFEMVRAAMRRSAGRCEAFWCEGEFSDNVLSLLGDAAPSLKSLRLIGCDDIVDSTFKVLITKFPVQEELELSNCWHRFPRTLEVIGDACPLLKRFRLSQRSFYSPRVGDSAAMAMMPELQSLQLTANSLTNSGLELILNGCPLLESLDIRSCYHVCMDDDMQAKCSRIRTLRHPEDSMDDYDLSFDYTIPRPCWSTKPIEYAMSCTSPY
ncbi:hypothetical protein CFC21_108347 [Triticum aestivum]|uniref:F-box domain-containing protein n=2 Tax=Triticum aestivum TaxID=4565 RepID=A0A9R1MI49_WHEAT|nr:putative F-box/LRR-repeat protein 23 [Triticum aestivum]KAF7107762.1 hypothetical protein CFC21_108347 [Triticum aestivum]